MSTDPEKKRLKMIREAEFGHELAQLQRVMREHFREASRRQVEWLGEITDRYMERGVWPAVPMLLLPSYYTDRRDMEVALFVAALMPEDGDVMERMGEMRAVMGEHPWVWFAERRFVPLSLGTTMKDRTGGVTNWKIAELMQRLWDDNPPDTFFGPVHRMAVSHLAEDTPYIGALYELYDGLCDVKPYRIRLLLLVLGSSDGFGLALWPVDTEELRCPLTDDVRLFLETWFPDAKRYGAFDRCVHEFGFRDDYLFWYAYLGYSALKKVEPGKCAYLATRYGRWYKDYIRPTRSAWLKMLPEIRFE